MVTKTSTLISEYNFEGTWNLQLQNIISHHTQMQAPYANQATDQKSYLFAGSSTRQC